LDDERACRLPRRRALAALAFAPFALLAQSPRPRKRVALVGFADMFGEDNGLEAVAKDLARRGIVEGRQVDIVHVVIHSPPEEERGRGLDYLVPKLEQQVLPAKPDVVVVLGSIMTKGMHLATREIPIVGAMADPVDIGVARSLARPGGNVTGVAGGAAETAVKTVEFLKALVPRLSRVAIFHDSRPMATRFSGHYERAAKVMGLEPVMIGGLEAADHLKALRGISSRRVQAGLVAWTETEPKDIAREAIALRLPVVGAGEHFTEAGLLASYSATNVSPAPKLAAAVEQVLRGVDPATIPFQFPQEFRLVINRRTANALNLVVPPDMLLRADRVIE